MAKRGAAMLEGLEGEFASGPGPARRPPGRPAGARRDRVEDFAEQRAATLTGDERSPPPRRLTGPGPRSGLKVTLRGRIFATVAGRIGTLLSLLALTGAMIWLLVVMRSFLVADARFRLTPASAIEIEGTRHLTRSRVLSVFGEDLDRNIFHLSLDERRAQLEAIPWVEHATVMRLLPGRVRVALVERTPVAFVRQGSHIGLVDAHGVLLDMDAGSPGARYSFPVVTGIEAADPVSTRAARMQIYAHFVAELDGAGEKNTEAVSEVDLSNPEDVRAMVEVQGATVLVHFGDTAFLERFRRAKELMPRWHAQYPNLASADMRYEHEIPLAMAAPAVARLAAPPAAQESLKAGAKPVAIKTPAVGRVKRPSPPPPVLHATAPRPATSSEAVADWTPLKAAARTALPAPAHPVNTVSPPERGFVQAAPAKPWKQPAPPAAVVPRKVPAPAPHSASAAARAMSPPVVAPATAAGGRKPSAGRPLMPDTSNSQSQAGVP